jgi:deazaflavin-dependent oxidoreductase (nitroreductase family)
MNAAAKRLAAVADRSTLRLTHHGRKTGKPYDVTIWFMVDGDTLYLPTMNTGRQWARNVQAKPHVRLQIGTASFAGRVTRVTDRKKILHVYELLTRKYWIPWLLDWFAMLIGRDPRKTGVDLGRGGFFHVQLDKE